MRFWSVLGLSLGLLCVHAKAAPRWQVGAQEQVQLRQAVDGRFSTRFAQGQLREHMSSVDVAGLALDAVAIDYDPARLTQMLAALPPLLDRNPASKTFGNIRWYQGEPQVVDRNGIEFVTRKAVLIWLLYADRLTPPQHALLRDLLDTARTGIPRHGVAISYTNIWLMKTWNLIALGEGLQDDALARQGYRMLADWLAYTRRTGINEYLSPSYYDVDLESLALIHNLSRDAGARQLAREALDLFWHDIALNWYAPAGRLGGTHSRDYNRLFNVGGVNAWVARAGWVGGLESRAQPASSGRGPYEAVAWASPPAQAAEWLQGPFPRRISARWGEEPEKRYTHYLGRNFSIASAESGYFAGHDNSPLVINLGAGRMCPSSISSWMDGATTTGQNKTLEAGSGHLKALHLRPFLSSAQHDNEVLFLASVRDLRPELSALESVVTLPADAEYWLDERKLDLFTASSRWIYDFGPNQQSTFIDVKKREGRDELLLSDRDDRLGVGVSRIFPVSAGTYYRLAASLQGGEVFLYLNYLDSARRLIGGEHAIRVAGGQGDFVERAFSLQAPAGAVWCKAWLYSTSSNRTELRVADLRFEALSDGGRFRAAASAASISVSMCRSRSKFPPVPRSLYDARGRSPRCACLAPGMWRASPVGFVLHNDGLAYRALRLTATHSASRSDQRASLAMWAYANEGFSDAEAFARLRQQIVRRPFQASLQGSMLAASLDGGAADLALSADVGSGAASVAQGLRARAGGGCVRGQRPRA